MTIEEEFFKINIGIAKIENQLTESWLGGLKIPFGIMQTVSAISICVFTGCFNVFEGNNKKINKFSRNHILHGMGNIVSGTVECIPFVSICILKVRRHIAESNKDPHYQDYADRGIILDLSKWERAPSKNIDHLDTQEYKDHIKKYLHTYSHDQYEKMRKDAILLNPRTKILSYFSEDEFHKFVLQIPTLHEGTMIFRYYKLNNGNIILPKKIIQKDWEGKMDSEQVIKVGADL